MSEKRARRAKIHVHAVQHMDGAHDTMEQHAAGMLLETPDGFRVTYTHKDGGISTRTTVQTIGKDRVLVTRSGGVRSAMHFEAGTVHKTAYETPYGVIALAICTESVENRLTPAGGTLRFSYALEFPSQPAIHHHMTLTVRPSEKEETTGENDVETGQRD